MKSFKSGVVFSFLLLCLGYAGLAQHDFNYLAIGDSYTIGESIEPENSWPHRLSDKIGTLINKAVNVKIIAQTGWRADELIAALSQSDLSTNHDLVTLLIGVNNQYQEKPISEFKADFNTLLKTAIHLAGDDASRVFVVSIPDYGYSPYGHSTGDQLKITSELEAYNALVKTSCARMQVTFVDITPISQNSDRSWYAEDGLHPSALQYGAWVEKIKTLVIPRLKALE